MKRAVVALAASALVLSLAAACQRREEVTDAPPATEVSGAPETPADQAAPLTYSRETAYATVELELPQAIAAYPDLHAAIYGEEVRALREFLEGAQSVHTEYGGEDMPPYEQTITYEPAGESARLFSLRETSSEYTGGAHGMYGFSGVLWDKASDRRIEPGTLFRSGADLAALDRALCDAINAARTEFVGEPSALTMTERDGWACPRAIETPFVLAPSTTTGRAGGLEFLIGPYLVGPFAEGAYRIVVPQAAFRGLLNQAYAGEFAGAPPRVGDVTPREPVTQAR